MFVVQKKPVKIWINIYSIIHTPLSVAASFDSNTKELKWHDDIQHYLSIYNAPVEI